MTHVVSRELEVGFSLDELSLGCRFGVDIEIDIWMWDFQYHCEKDPKTPNIILAPSVH